MTSRRSGCRDLDAVARRVAAIVVIAYTPSAPTSAAHQDVQQAALIVAATNLGEQGRRSQRDSAEVQLFAGAAAVLMGIITAEALYPIAPRYNTHTSSVSDLAAMRPDNIVRQPSAMIFNVTMILAGLAFAIAAYLLHRKDNGRRMTVPLALLGLGMVGVGFVPGNHLALHTLFAMTAFVSGDVGALLTAKSHTGALRHIFRCLGIVSLTSLAI